MSFLKRIGAIAKGKSGAKKPHEHEQIITVKEQTFKPEQITASGDANHMPELSPVEERLDRLKTLTPREREVYELIRAGVTGNRELAETLHVSVATVKTLLGRIYEKTGVSSKTHLVLSDL